MQFLEGCEKDMNMVSFFFIDAKIQIDGLALFAVVFCRVRQWCQSTYII